MKNTYLILYILLFSIINTYAQVSINADDSSADPSAMLDVSSTNKGVLIPRMTTAQRDGISNPSVGLTIFNLDDKCTDIYDGSTWMKDCPLVSTDDPSIWTQSVPSGFMILDNERNDIDEDTKIQVEESSDEDVIRFDVAGTEALVIDASSNIEATGDISANAFIGDGSQLSNININDADNDPNNELNIGATLNGTSLEITDGGGTFSTDLSGLDDEDWIIGTNTLYKLNDNIGIGEANPQTTLDVVDKAVIGNLNIGNQSTDQTSSNASGDGYMTTPWIYTTAIEAQGERGTASTLITLGKDDTYSLVADEIHFITNGKSQLEIDANGKIGLRRNSDASPALNPITDIHLKQSSQNTGTGTGGIKFEENDDANDYWRTYHDGTFFSFNRQGGRVAYINTNGNLIPNSDRRLKNSIEEMDAVLDRVMQLRPVSYRYNHQDASAQKTLGFIAQEVQSLFPEMVVEGEDGYLGIGYASAGIIAIKAVQEQQEMLEAQKEKYEALEKESKDLKTEIQARTSILEQSLKQLEAELEKE